MSIRADLSKTVVGVLGLLKVCDSGIRNKLRNQTKINFKWCFILRSSHEGKSINEGFYSIKAGCSLSSMVGTLNPFTASSFSPGGTHLYGLYHGLRGSKR